MRNNLPQYIGVLMQKLWRTVQRLPIQKAMYNFCLRQSKAKDQGLEPCFLP